MKYLHLFCAALEAKLKTLFQRLTGKTFVFCYGKVHRLIYVDCLSLVEVSEINKQISELFSSDMYIKSE